MEWFGIFVLTILSGVNAHTNDSCTTPTGEKGECVLWRECSLYSSYVEEGRTDPMKEAFLRERVCKAEGANIYLCCVDNYTIQHLAQTTQLIPTEDQCGFPSRVSSTEPGAWPWLALLGQYETDGSYLPVCHGTLITSRHVLSVAHCFASWAPIKPTVVRLGEFNLKNNFRGERPEDYRVLLFNIDHFVQKSFQNDIIVLPLDREVIFTDAVRPVCLPFPYRDENFEAKNVILIGYGSTDLAHTSKVPIAVETPVVNLAECQLKYKTNRPTSIRIDETNICTGDGSAGSCQGDSGSGLVYYNPLKNRYYIVGIVSYGSPECASFQFPDINTRVTSFLDWIRNQVV